MAADVEKMRAVLEALQQEYYGSSICTKVYIFLDIYTEIGYITCESCARVCVLNNEKHEHSSHMYTHT